MPSRLKRKIDLIVIHCSATPNGAPVTVRAIDRWHDNRGFRRNDAARQANRPELTSIGYHVVIDVDGTINLGRDLEEVGAHVKGHNRRSIGICMVGTDYYSEAQWLALYRVLVDTMKQVTGRTNINTTHSLIQALGVHGVNLKGHRDLSPDSDGDGVVEKHEWLKTCPGFEVSEWIQNDFRPLGSFDQ